MTHPALKEILFAEHRHLDRQQHQVPGEFITGLKSVALVVGIIAVCFAVFYGLVILCLALDISAWWAGAFYVALYALWLCKHFKGARLKEARDAIVRVEGRS